MKVKLETIDSGYSELFRVTFLHSGYVTGFDNFLSRGISVEPDNSTKKIFADYKMNYNFYNNVLSCYVQSSLAVPAKPSVKIDPAVKIRFLIKNRDDFFNKTYVAAAGNKKLYQFSNKINNISGTSIFLSASVENWATAKDYDQGTVAQKGGKLYGALKPVQAINNTNVTDVNFWKQLTPFEQVVNNADLKDADMVDIDPNVNCFAVIDVYSSGTTNNKYKLLDNSNNLLTPAPLFTIKFKSKF